MDIRIDTARRWLLAGLLICTLSAAAQSPVMLNFVNADIEAVTRAIGQLAGRNFLLDPRVKGTLNIHSVKPVTPEQAYHILIAALRMQGFAVVEGAGVVKVLPEADAKQHGGRTFGRELRAGGDQIVTQVYPLAHASAAQLVPVLRPLIAPNNAISAYPGANILVITDYADNLRRISRIIEAIDRPNEGEFEVLRLEHLSAIELAQQLTRLFAEPGQAGGQPQAVTIAADARSNSLLVRADNPGRMANLRELVRRLDVPATGAGQLRVVHLRNAEAAKLAETLRALAGAEAKAAAAPAAPAQPAAGAAGAGGVVIAADAATNSLIIHAPDHAYNALRAVIDRLDTRRAQVFVEALIVEVSSSKAAEFGIQWQAPLLEGRNAALVGGTNFGSGGNNLLGLTASIAAGKPQLPGPGLNLGLLQRISVGGKTYEGLTALARALEQDADANILSTPNLLTLDNEEAKIVIGQNVPFLTGAYAQTGTGPGGTTVNPFQTFERRDVGLTLKVRPQVSEGGAVKLTIVQEVSSVQETTQQGVITNKRAIETTVRVQSGEAIVLGGLIQDDQQQGQDKVPGLGELPLIGQLFRSDTRKRRKTNLMVFLRPLVIHETETLERLTADRYELIEALHRQAQQRPAHWLLEASPPQRLPDLKLDRVLSPRPQTDPPRPPAAAWPQGMYD
ncbi:MAG: type II secretion system secretin GspD [Burkholderiales bacterium]|nr:type II secretion system secretin GspD [Burkholderiales bacterium]